MHEAPSEGITILDSPTGALKAKAREAAKTGQIKLLMGGEQHQAPQNRTQPRICKELGRSWDLSSPPLHTQSLRMSPGLGPRYSAPSTGLFATLSLYRACQKAGRYIQGPGHEQEWLVPKAQAGDQADTTPPSNRPLGDRGLL